jgi:heptosyltransferase-1
VARVRADLSKEGLSHYLVLSPGGGWRSKCWPTERFGALCKKIRAELSIPCVINYGPGEEALASEVQAASGGANPISYDGELGPLSALLRNAQCIVGGDTGPLHLAIALGTPAVALFGPTDPARNGPYPPGQIVLRSPNAVTTYGRIDATDPSLLDLSVEAVFAAVKRRLEART